MDKYLLFFLTIVIAAVVLPSDTPLLFILMVAHVFFLTTYCYGKYPSFYIHSVSNGYLFPKGFEILFRFTAYLVNAVVFLLLSMIFVSKIINLFTLPFTLQNLLNTPWLYAVCFLLSGSTYLLFFKYLYKLATKQSSNPLIQKKEEF
jgi:hypothetical protein